MARFDDFLSQPEANAPLPKEERAADIHAPEPVRTAPVVESSAPSKFDSFVSGHEEAGRLGLSVRTAADRNPETAARVLRLKQKTGLDEGLIERNVDQIERDSARSDFDPDTYRKTSPIVAGWLAESPNHAAAAKDDLSKLGYIEGQIEGLKRMFGYTRDQFLSGVNMTEASDIGFDDLLGKATPHQLRRQQQLKSEAEARGNKTYGVDNFFLQIPGAVANQLPILAKTLTEGAKLGGAGAALGAAGGAVVGGTAGALSPVPGGAVAGAIEGAKAGGRLGGSSGFKVGMALSGAKMEAGNAYIDYKTMTDENGNLMDPKAAKVAAFTVGAINGALEFASLKSVAKSIPGVRGLMGQGMKEVLASKTGRKLLTTYAGHMLESTVAEGSTEFMQSLVTHAGGEFAKMYADGSLKKMSSEQILSRIFSADALSQAIAEGKAGAQAGLGMAGAGSASTAYSDVRRIKEAQGTAQAFRNLGLGIKDSKLHASLPEKTKEVLERLTKDSPVEKVFAPVEKWNEYWQSKTDEKGEAIDPRAVIQEITGDTKSYDEAMATGGDIAISTADYATRIGPTEHNEFFADEIRRDATAMNGREAREFFQKVEEQEKAQTEAGNKEAAPGDAVIENVRKQLEAAGETPGGAEVLSKIYRFFGVLGEKTGIDPMALYERYALKIQGPDQEQGPVSQPYDPLDSQLERIRTGDLPAEQIETTGPSLLEFLKSRGGIRESEHSLFGDLAALEPDTKASGKARLIRNTGMDLETAAIDAAERGYISEPNAEELIAKIGSEVAGQPQYAAGGVTGNTRTSDQEIFDLRDSLRDLGIDLSKHDNETAKTALKKREKVPADPESIMLQKDLVDAKGRIRFGSDRKFHIDIFEQADFSTFLHESGHFFLEVLGDVALADGAPDRVSKDYAAVLKWLGVDSREEIETKHHEQFARGFEAYLREGKAPSASLRSAFATFAVWLQHIYKRLTDLRVKMSPEITEVFDRMLATDQEIDAAQSEQGMSPLYKNTLEAGMSESDAKKYDEAVKAAHEQATAQVRQKVMSELYREREKWWKDRRSNLREQVAAGVNSRKEYVALSILSKGKLPDGSPLPTGMNSIKLDRQAIVDDFGKERLKVLPRPYIYAREGGVHPDMAAQIFGFGSGDELMSSLSALESREGLIDRETDSQMRDLYGDLTKDGQLPIEAMKAVHNEKRAQVLQMELQHLASNNLPVLKEAIRRITRRVPDLKLVREQAQAMVASKKIREINPFLYQRAELKAGKEAVEFLLKGDHEQAFEAKQRELLNHELYRAATEAREKVDGIVAYMAKFSKPTTRERIGKAGADYLEQIDDILDRYDFRKSVSGRAVAKRKSLLEWVAEQKELGVSVQITSEVLAEAKRQHYKDTAYADLLGLTDAVKIIEHLARTKNKLIALKEKRDFEEVKSGILSTIAAHHKVRDDAINISPTLADKWIGAANTMRAAHTRIESLLTFLDGGKELGSIWRAFFEPTVAAEQEKTLLTHEYNEKLTEIFSPYSDKEKKQWYSKRFYIPEIRTASAKANLTKADMIAVALNWGNEYNRDALLRGYGWSEAQVMKIFEHLDERDWKTVQAVWDMLESFWPRIEKLEKEIHGVAPEKVEHLPFTISAGGTSVEMRGGYYPIKFNAELSPKALEFKEDEMLADQFGGSVQAATKQGHAKARTDTGGKPLLLELGVLSNHLNTIIHDITHRKTVIDLAKLLRDKEITRAIENAAGREAAREIKPWLKKVAGAKAMDAAAWYEPWIRTIQRNATVVNIGLKVSSVAIQTADLPAMAQKIGSKNLVSGFIDAYAPWNLHKIADTWKFVTERSEHMKNLIEHKERDARDNLTQQNVLESPSLVGAVGEKIRNASFKGVHAIDMILHLPLWLGAYNRANSGGIENVTKGDEKSSAQYADHVVRTTLSSGEAKDRSSIQDGTALHRAMTMFYSPMNIRFNQMQNAALQFRLDRDPVRLVQSMAMLWVLPVFMEEFIRGRIGGSEDDEDYSWFGHLIMPLIGYLPAHLVGIRDVAGAIERAKGTGTVKYSPSPIVDAVSAVGQGIYSGYGVAVNGLSDEEISRKALKETIHSAGYALGLPTRQTWMTLEYLHDWNAGEENPDSTIEGIYRATLGGKPKQK